MGKIVFAGAMSHVLDPDYYDRACGAVGRRMITETMTAIAQMGVRFAETKADALVVVADDHLNAFSFNCVPAICVRIAGVIGRSGSPRNVAIESSQMRYCAFHVGLFCGMRAPVL